MNRIYYAAALSLSLLTMAGCKKDKNNSNTGTHTTGYNASQDNVSTTPKQLNTRNLAGTGAANLPSSYFLYNYLPPVGDQGQYGTCIGWSTAYYTKTALDAASLNLSSSQLAQTGYQMSAKDLFTAIADNQKGANCDGTYYDAALSMMQTRGVASLASVPYTNLGGCAQSTSSNNTDAGSHKIASYRAIQHTNVADYVADIKQSLVSNSPVMVGCKVGAGFQSWTGGGVMSAGFDPCGGGQPCGGHAQTIVGYDDNKGANGAFRVINSWSNNWGDNGFYWVDYNFLFNTLAQTDGSGNYPIYVATNAQSTTPPVVQSSGVDLDAWVQEDVSLSSGSTSRSVVFDIYNDGTSTAYSATGWGLYYLYYNAYDATDYGIILHDEFGSLVPQYQSSCSGNTCDVNVDIPANGDLAYTWFSQNIMHQNYTMPTNVTGYYYLILVADAGETLGDADYSNNVFYVDDEPRYFSYGVGKNGPGAVTTTDFHNPIDNTKMNRAAHTYRTAVTTAHRNAYTPQEIRNFIKAKKRNGELDARARAMNPANTTVIAGH